MIIHKRNTLKGRPVCWDENLSIAIMMADNVDKVSCADCLRRLAKDAVIYGNGRRAKKR